MNLNAKAPLVPRAGGASRSGTPRHGERREPSSLEALEHHNRVLRELFATIRQNRGSDVEQRYEFGNCVKEVVRHVGDREGALRDVVAGIAHIPSLAAVAERLRSFDTSMRDRYDQVGDMSRGIKGIDLNIGQDFDGAFLPLMEVMSSEIDWELGEAIPLIERTRQELSGEPIPLHSERYAEHHAPTTLSRHGPRWYEQSATISRLLTMYDHLRDDPRAAKRSRVR